MEIFTEPITEKEILLPKGVKYESTYRGCTVNTISGIEFFKKGIEDKLLAVGSSILGICILSFFLYPESRRFSNNTFYMSQFLIIPTFIGAILFIFGNLMKKIKTTMTVSSTGIEIKAKKNYLFIKKENIANIYVIQGLSEEGNSNPLNSNPLNIFLSLGTQIQGTQFHLSNYKVILVCKAPIKLPYCNDIKDKFDLFYSHFFYTKKSAVFFVQEFIKILELDLNVTFIDSNKE